MAEKSRRKFSSKDKVALLKRHLLGKESVSAICEELTIAPNQFYRWQQEFFENGAAAFEPIRGPEIQKYRKYEEKVQQLESKLNDKVQVIAEITEEYVKLKKNFGMT